MKGVETQVVSLIAKLTLINPLLNGIDGGTRSTLGDVSSLLSHTGSGSSLATMIAQPGSVASGSFGYGGLAAYAGTGNAGAASQPSIFAQLGSLPGALGAGGTVNGLGSVGSWLNTKPGFLGGSTSYAGAIGAAGYGINGIMDFTKGGTGNAIAGIGSTAAATLAFIPGLQAFAPIAAIGGSLLGSLFGGHPKNPYTIDNVGLSGGHLALGETWNQAQNDTITAQLRTDISGINATLSQVGASFSQMSGQIGSVRNDPNNKNSALQQVTLAQQLGGHGLTSAQASYATILGGLPASFDSVSAFQQTITQMKAMADTVDALGLHISDFNKDTQKLTIDSLTGGSYSANATAAINSAIVGHSYTASDLQSAISAAVNFSDTTYPQLISKTISGQQSYLDQLIDLGKTYSAAESQASSYGLSVSALGATYERLVQDGLALQLTALRQSDSSVTARYLSATGDQQGADLLNFDTSAAQQRTALANSWQAIYGIAYADAQEYANEVTNLDRTLAAERLKIQQGYADQATQAAQQSAAKQAQILASAQGNVGNLIDGIGNYAKSLLLDDSSPLTAAQRYQSANSNWQTDLAAAQSGNVMALQALTGDASAFLGQSRSYYGSNVQASSDYQAVLDGLRSVAGMGSGALTQAFMTATTEDQTQTLSDKLDQVVAAVDRARLEIQQGNRRAS